MIPVKLAATRKVLRIAAWLILLAGAVVWFATGRHPGWSSTSATRLEKDPVTDLEYPVVEKKFTAGVDFLGACLLAAGGLGAVSFLGRKK